MTTVHYIPPSFIHHHDASVISYVLIVRGLRRSFGGLTPNSLSLYAQTVLRLRSPDHTPFTFNAISHGTGALTSVTWNDTLERAIARLRRGVTVPETSLERSTKSWRLWRASSASVEDRSSRASSIMSLSASGLVSQDRTLRPLVSVEFAGRGVLEMKGLSHA